MEGSSLQSWVKDESHAKSDNKSIDGDSHRNSERVGNNESQDKSHNNSKSNNGSGHDETKLKYLALYRAVLRGDWGTASRFFQNDPEAITARFGIWGKTALHIAVGTGRAIQFVEKLVELMPSEALASPDNDGNTALIDAVKANNLEAVKVLVEKNPGLTNIWKKKTQVVPLFVAPRYANREMILYLLAATRDDVQASPFSGLEGSRLLNNLIINGHYDIAVHVVGSHPDIARFPRKDGLSPLEILAGHSSSFPSGIRFSLWQRLIYHYVPTKLENSSKKANGGDVENPIDGSHLWKSNYWWFLLLKVPFVKHIHEIKVKHHQILQLVKILCEEVMKLKYREISGIFERAVSKAAVFGIPEIIEEIVELFPFALWFEDENSRGIFELAVSNRREKVFNLIYQIGMHKKLIVHFVNQSQRDNILHLAGQLAPAHQLSLVTGAALQMQRELQWFKEVEKIVRPDFAKRMNKDSKTPYMVFCEKHRELAKEGEKWMKEAANSYILVAALIATVVFAAAITIPGGNRDSGVPIFSEDGVFTVFAVSDALSLFSSIASILIFLSILTTRYAEIDFLYSLPKRLIFGLFTLFLSITSMMIAFSATLYLVFGDEKAWVLILVAVLTFFPVTLYARLQFPALVEVIYSTYGRGIFRKQSNRLLY